MSRALHFHHRERVKNRRENHQVHQCLMGLSLAEKDVRASKRINTPTPCSCAMCGNPRKHFRQLTRAEQKAILNLQDQ